MLLGMPGDATYANYREANRALWRQTILPLAGKLLSAIAQGLGRTFPGATLGVDLDRVTELSEDRERLWAQVNTAGFLTLDEKREAVGLKALAVEEEPIGEEPEDAPEFAPERDDDQLEVKFNPYHDPRNGQFTFAPGGPGGVRAGEVLPQAVREAPTAFGPGGEEFRLPRGSTESLAPVRFATLDRVDLPPELGGQDVTRSDAIDISLDGLSVNNRRAGPRGPRPGIGHNGGPPLDPIVIEVLSAPPPKPISRLMFGLLDDALDLTGPAYEVQLALADARIDRLTAELRRLNPKFKELPSIRASGPETLTSKMNRLDQLDAEAERLSYGKFGSARALQAEALKVYQRGIDHGWKKALSRRNAGTLTMRGPNDPSQRAMGRVVDEEARLELRNWLSANGIREGKGYRVRVNRRQYDGDQLRYRQPDVAIGRMIFDGSLSRKTPESYDQIRDFIYFSKPEAIIIVRPTALGGASVVYRGE